MTNYTANHITINGQEIPYYRVDSDVNGNPRYVIHFFDLGIKLADYGKIKGLTKYRAKWFGGGYVFQSYNLESDLKNYYLPLVEAFYKEEDARTCNTCGKAMDEGYCIGGGEQYYCSDDCLQTEFSREEILELELGTEDSDNYWTTWEE